MRRWLFLLHRWAGIALCLLMAAWFLSGIVMLYVGYPKLTAKERLLRLPRLPLNDCCLAPADALARAGVRTTPDELRLAVVAGAPRYLVRHGRDGWSAIDARDGHPMPGADDAIALAAARDFEPGAAVRHLGLVQEDAWTHSRALDAHRPLHLVALADAAGTELYVSSRTGEVVRDSNRHERAWNRVGAWLHWLYMFRGNRFDAAWSNIVIFASLAGTLTALLGTWIGVMRWRARSLYRKRASHTPYREAWMRWHHLLGLAFAGATILWIFSGLMSMNPWQIFRPAHHADEAHAFAGGALDPAAFRVLPAEAARRAADGLGPIKELRWHWFDGRPWIIASDETGATRILAGDREAQAFERFDTARLVRAAARSRPDAHVVRATLLTDYDNWYVARASHTMLGHVERRLPMLRVEFDDPAGTWLHVDPHTGAVHNRLDNRARWKRWLFAAFHSWDLPWLLARRPLWDLLMIGFSLGGTALCLTGVVLAWRRLGRWARTAAHAMQAREPTDHGRAA